MSPDQTNIVQKTPQVVQTAADSSYEQTLLILGASGDLTERLLLPGAKGPLIDLPGIWEF